MQVATYEPVFCCAGRETTSDDISWFRVLEPLAALVEHVALMSSARNQSAPAARNGQGTRKQHHGKGARMQK